MKHKNAVLLLVFLPVFIFSMAGDAIGQCSGNRVFHTAGTQMIGCTDVTVTSEGYVGVDYWVPCVYGPYILGPDGTGSYIFSFSTPVQAVIIDVQTLNNKNGNIEEMAVEVNGIFHPLTSAGNADGCWEHAMIWPPGTLRAPDGEFGSASEVYIPGPINTIKITDTWIAGTPIGIAVSVYFCCANCVTNAGDINAAPTILCENEPFVFPAAEQPLLEPDDLLQYILFTSLTNIEGSLIAVSNTPQFAFAPAFMVPGSTYYVAAIAGNNLNGNVDFDDPCFDISNVVEVTWMLAPIVTLFSEHPCLNPGECYDIVINFLGVPPFQLSGQVVMGNTVVSTFNGTYTTMSTVQVVCIPTNAPLGPITIEATSLSDAFCTCD